MSDCVPLFQTLSVSPPEVLMDWQTVHEQAAAVEDAADAADCMETSLSW